VKELQNVRDQFSDNVTVDFAALSMRIVVDYLIKRTSRAHPESVRFLLEVTDFLDRNLATSGKDPLQAFHLILSRYEKYKSTVRKAEGLPDRKPPILNDLEIDNPEVFSEAVQSQAATIIRAGNSLAGRINSTQDPANLIRSFRFLVNRSVNRILDSTYKQKKTSKKGSKRRRVP
jgi:hypothetical protein